jgi:Bacterial protein of unknown function (DUF948)
MDAGQLAALIAAGFWAVLVCAAVYVLVRLARLIRAATAMMTAYRDDARALMERAQVTLDRTNEQLARTDAITSSMDQVTANMANLSGHVSDLAGLAGGISAAFGTPLLKLSATAFGIRRAVAIRRSVPIPAAPAAGVRGALPGGSASSRVERRERARR